MLPGITPALFADAGPSGNDSFTKILLHGDGANNSTVFTDSALPAKTWTAASGAHIYNPATGAFGGAAMGFNGSSWFAYTPNIAALNFAALDWTIDTRVQFIGLQSGGYSCFVTAMDASAQCHDVFFVLDNYSAPGTPKLCFGWSINGTVQNQLLANWTPALNTWYHVAAQRKGGTVSLWVNGVLLTSGAISGSIAYSAPNLCIAASNNGQYNFLSGFLEETRVSIGIARYSGNFAPPTKPYGPDPDLTARLLLHMDGPNGSKTFPDTSQWSKPNPTVGGNAKVSTAQSKFGGASAQFGATGDYLSYPTSAPDWDFGANDFTVEAWMFPTALPSDSTVIMHPSTATGFADAWKLVIRATDKIIRFVHSVSSSNIVQLQSVNPAVLNVWTHIAAVRSGNNLTLYVNGIAEATGTYSGALPAITGPLNIGTGDTTPGNGFFTGYIDEVRISNGLARWTANFTPPIAPYP